jgi:hypothetical protein
MMRRLADHYIVGCPVDSVEWREADSAVSEAFWSGDLCALRAASARYERIYAGATRPRESCSHQLR